MLPRAQQENTSEEKGIWPQRCVFLAKKDRQVGGKAGHPEFTFANGSTLGKCDSEFYQIPLLIPTAERCLSVLPSELQEDAPLGGKSSACLTMYAK